MNEKFGGDLDPDLNKNDSPENPAQKGITSEAAERDFQERRKGVHADQEHKGVRIPVGLEISPSLRVARTYIGNVLSGPKIFLESLEPGMDRAEVEDIAVDYRQWSDPEATREDVAKTPYDDLISLRTYEDYI